ncbi:hypothetical protein B0H11DRAFT_1909812 [Mycena galericulata]|nr:hypothetical protein B0H11DRAFT_1909812 [Mycena galericulata]
MSNALEFRKTVRPVVVRAFPSNSGSKSNGGTDQGSGVQGQLLTRKNEDPTPCTPRRLPTRKTMATPRDKVEQGGTSFSFLLFAKPWFYPFDPQLHGGPRRYRPVGESEWPRWAPWSTYRRRPMWWACRTLCLREPPSLALSPAPVRRLWWYLRASQSRLSISARKVHPVRHHSPGGELRTSPFPLPADYIAHDICIGVSGPPPPPTSCPDPESRGPDPDAHPHPHPHPHPSFDDPHPRPRLRFPNLDPRARPHRALGEPHVAGAAPRYPNPGGRRVCYVCSVSSASARTHRESAVGATLITNGRAEYNERTNMSRQTKCRACDDEFRVRLKSVDNAPCIGGIARRDESSPLHSGLYVRMWEWNGGVRELRVSSREVDRWLVPTPALMCSRGGRWAASGLQNRDAGEVPMCNYRTPEPLIRCLH